MNQRTFNPVDYRFNWTADGWYTFDQSEAIKDARRERDQLAKELKSEGRTVKKGSLGKQRITRGGIGSGNPEIDFIVPVYVVNWS